MGQQQLLLVVLAIIIVGMAVIAGILLFQRNSMDSKRDNVINESVNLSSMAQRYYIRPTGIGGGGHSFIGWSIPPELDTTSNGYYRAVITDQRVIITGVGNEVVTGSDSVRVITTVNPGDYSVEVIN